MTPAEEQVIAAIIGALGVTIARFFDDSDHPQTQRENFLRCIEGYAGIYSRQVESLDGYEQVEQGVQIVLQEVREVVRTTVDRDLHST